MRLVSLGSFGPLQKLDAAREIDKTMSGQPLSILSVKNNQWEDVKELNETSENL